MSRLRGFWRAFERIAVLFSFIVNFVLVIILLMSGVLAADALVEPGRIRNDVACPMISDVDGLVKDLDRAVIRRTIQINQTIPVEFNLPLDKQMSVNLTSGVPINRPTQFNLPGNGGAINGSVSLTLPKGQSLPIHMNTTVAVSQTLPIRMNVPVEIPLKETDLGPIIDRLDKMLTPYLSLLNGMLGCE